MSSRRAIMLVARREIRERLRSKVFVSTLVMLLIVGGSTALQGALEGADVSRRRHRTGARRPCGCAPTRGRAFRRREASTCVWSRRRPWGGAPSSPSTSTRFCSSRRIGWSSAPTSTPAAAIADSAVRALRNQLPRSPELTTATLHRPDTKTTDAHTLVAYVGSLLLLTSLAIYGQWVVSGVIEEKNNRVVELILSTVRPRHMLAGKVIGIGLLGLSQLGLVAGLAAALLVAGVFDAPAGLGGSVALVIPWFALGFALYAAAYAAAGALASPATECGHCGTTRYVHTPRRLLRGLRRPRK